MSCSTPSDFHVERIPRCANPACSVAIGSESQFCQRCWGRLRQGTRDRIRICHTTRNQPGLNSHIRRAVGELKAIAAKSKAPTIAAKSKGRQR